jgi:hypothetical protein
VLSRDPLEPSAPWACQVTMNLRAKIRESERGRGREREGGGREREGERERERGMAGSVPHVLSEEGKVRVLFET